MQGLVCICSAQGRVSPAVLPFCPSRTAKPEKSSYPNSSTFPSHLPAKSAATVREALRGADGEEDTCTGAVKPLKIGDMHAAFNVFAELTNREIRKSKLNDLL